MLLLSLLLLLFTLFFFRVFPRARSLLHWFENFCSVHLLRVCQNRNYRRKFCLIYKSIDIRCYRCCCCCCGSPPSFSVYFPLSCHQLAASSSSLAWVDCFFFLHKNRFLHFKLSWFRFGEFSPSRLKKTDWSNWPAGYFRSSGKSLQKLCVLFTPLRQGRPSTSRISFPLSVSLPDDVLSSLCRTTLHRFY